MILVRDELQIAPDQMKSVKETAGEMMSLEAGLGVKPSRMMTDLTGDYYSLVIETERQDLAAFESWLTKLMADEKWQKSYGRMRPHVRGGRRTVYTLLR